MKRIVLVSFFIVLYGISFAQGTAGIEFSDGSWTEIKAEAKAEKKLIFIDCHTSWCGPCKKLSKEVFTQPEVGDFFNQNFISYKVDMEKGVGIELREKYHVGAYPTLLWLDHKENLVHRIVGYIEADALLDEAQSALHCGNFDKSIGKKYKKDKDNPELVKAYMDYLIETADSRSKEVAKQYLSLLDDEDFLKPEVFNLIENHVDDPFIPAVEYVVSNYALFAEKFKESTVERLFSNIYFHYSNKLMRRVLSEGGLDDEAMEKLENQMGQINFKEKDLYLEKLRIKGLAYQKQWKPFAERVDKLLANDNSGKTPVRELQDWYTKVLESDCSEKEVIMSAISWIDLAIEKRDLQYVEPFLKMWEDKIALLKRAGGLQQEISNAEIELDLLERINKKQNAYKENLEKQKKFLEDLFKKKQ